MADIFDFYVYDDRSIQFTLAEPIMLEDKDVTQFRFRIPKVLNGFDMSTWAWWFVYVNALGTKYSVPLTLTDDEDEPENYSTATFTVNYGMSEKSGKVSFAIEVIDANTGGDILHEWHTKTYTTTVEETLQGNQVEYAEDESDIISALIQQVQALIADGGIDATDVDEGYVPTADGEGGWSWQAQQGGGGGGSSVSPYTSDPSALGTASAGTVNQYSRGNHVHPMPTAVQVGAIPAPSSPTTGAFLVWNGTAWVAQTLSTWQGGNY